MPQKLEPYQKGALMLDYDPATFRHFVLKMHGRCNLRCPYCYVYQMADQRWQTLPRMMGLDVMRQFATRLREHVQTFALPDGSVTLHGGEPTLLGAPAIDRYMELIDSIIADTGVALSKLIQTNGTLLTDTLIEVLARRGIRVGISVDGAKKWHDRTRVTHGGRPTYDTIAENIQRLCENHPDLLAGILCVINLEADPIAAYDALTRLLEPATSKIIGRDRWPMLDFRLPLGHWVSPPPGIDLRFRSPETPMRPDTPTPYADWLIKLFEHAERQRRVGLRILREIIEAVLSLVPGQDTSSESFGPPVRGPLIINTAGGYELVDALSSVDESIAILCWPDYDISDLNFYTNRRLISRPMTVFDASIYQAQIAAGITCYRLGIKGRVADGPHLCDTCTACPRRHTCGGGFYPNRWTGSDFWAPSVYCPDLAKVYRWVESHLASRLWATKPPFFQEPRGERLVEYLDRQ